MSRRKERSYLESKLIVVDPGHGGTTETFRQGMSGEREEWINLRVSLILRELLWSHGAKVKMTRCEDVPVSLDDRVAIAIDNEVDLFFSIHHNSASPVDPLLNDPMVFTHGHVDEGSLNGALAFCLGRQFSKSRGMDCFVDSDQILFPEGLHLLRNLHGQVPVVLGEYSFFSHENEERNLCCEDYCRKEAQAYLEAAEEFFCLEKKGGGYSSTSPLWSPEFRQSYMQRRDLLLLEGVTSWRDCWWKAQKLLENGDNMSAKEELLNSLALLRNHPRFLEVLEPLSSYGLVSVPDLSLIRSYVTF